MSDLRTTVIIGAGASLDAMPHLNMEEMTNTLLLEDVIPLENASVRPFLQYVKNILSISDPDNPGKANFETVYQYISDVYTALDQECRRIPNYQIPDYPGLTQRLCGDAMLYIQNGILELIKRAWYNFIYCRDMNAELSRQKEFFSYIRQNGNLDVFNLNYDPLYDECFSNANDGFEDDPDNNGPKIFNPEKAIKKNGDTYNHIHGSVYFSRAHPIEKYRKGPLFKYREPEWDVFTPDRIQNQSGELMLFSPIITGMLKLENTMHDPFRSYHSNLIQSMNSNNSCVVIGYGSGDYYVNAMIQSFLRRNNTKLVVINPNGVDGFLRKVLDNDNLWDSVLEIRTTMENAVNDLKNMELINSYLKA